MTNLPPKPYFFMPMADKPIMLVEVFDFTNDQAQAFFDELLELVRQHPAEAPLLILVDARHSAGTWSPVFRKGDLEVNRLVQARRLQAYTALLLQDKLMHNVIKNLVNVASHNLHRANIERQVFTQEDQAIGWLMKYTHRPTA